MKKIISLCYIVVGFSCINPLYALTSQHATVNYTVSAGTPIITSTTDTLDKGTWTFNQRLEYYRMTPLSDATLSESYDFESQTAFLVNYFTISYGMTDTLILGANLPLQRSYNMRGATQLADDTSFVIGNLGDISGVGDASSYGFWRITDDKAILPTALLFGINLPTGKTTARTKEGELFAVSDQPGTGAWAPFGGIIFSKSFNKLSVSSNFFYTQTTEGSQKTTIGSYFNYYFSIDYPILEYEGKKSYSVEGILELTGEYNAKDTIRGTKDPNSGGNIIYLDPGLRINIEDSFSWYVSVGIPIAETDYGKQVGSKYAIYTGIDLMF